MKSYIIENTIESDLQLICWMFDEAILYQKLKNYPVWNGYDVAVLQNDIAQKIQYKIVVNGEIACIFSVCYTDPIIWGKKDKGDAIYLHRIVVNPKHKGQKHFEKIFAWAKNHAIENDFNFIRMDTWADNPTIISYYCSFGFEFLTNFTTPNTADLPVQHRNLQLALLEYNIK
ncbi:MAG TPA: GNAT family N-acetyltransferase [Flavobacterium sp.]